MDQEIVRLEKFLEQILEPVEMDGDFRKDLFRRLIGEPHLSNGMQGWQYALLGGLVVATGVGSTVAVARVARSLRKRRRALAEEREPAPTQIAVVPVSSG